MANVGQLRHWIALQTRESNESGTTDATVEYTTITKVRAHVRNSSGTQFVGGRGSDNGNTHAVELRYIPALSKSNYILVLNGPFAGKRIKIDTHQDDELGRRIVLRGYSIGDKDAHVQPTKGTLPEIL
jgi:head-tail adaptor